MKKQESKIAVCPFCGWKTIITKDNSEIVGTDTILVWCENEHCQNEYVYGADMKIGHDYIKQCKEEWK